MNTRMTASLAGGIISALFALAAVRGLPFGGVLFWLTPLPLFAVAFGWGAAAAGTAVGVGALVGIVSGGPAATAAFVLLFGLPAVLFSGLALRGAATPSPVLPSLGLPFALLALWPAAMLLAAEVALADQPGGLSGALTRVVEEALSRMGATPEIGTADLVATVVRIKPLAFAIWFAIVMVANASAAQTFMLRRGLLASQPVRWSVASLPLWYAPVAVIPALVAGLAPGDAGFVASSLAMMLAVPLVLQGLAVVHVVTAGQKARPLMLGLAYAGLAIFLLPVGLALAGLGLAEFVLNLRRRALTRGSRPGQSPPED
jgi:hypothetical protein